MPQPQYDWLVRLHDQQDKQQTRRTHRDAHSEYLASQTQKGRIIMGGDCILPRELRNGEDRDNICGNIVVVKGSSKEDVWNLLRADPYAKLGVWDLDRTTIEPMKVGVSKPLPTEA